MSTVWTSRPFLTAPHPDKLLRVVPWLSLLLLCSTNAYNAMNHLIIIYFYLLLLTLIMENIQNRCDVVDRNVAEIVCCVDCRVQCDSGIGAVCQPASEVVSRLDG